MQFFGNLFLISYIYIMSNKQKIVELSWSGIKVIIVLFYIATIIYSIVKEEGSTAILLGAIFLTTSDFLSTSLKGYKKRNKLLIMKKLLIFNQDFGMAIFSVLGLIGYWFDLLYSYFIPFFLLIFVSAVLSGISYYNQRKKL